MYVASYLPYFLGQVVQGVSTENKFESFMHFSVLIGYLSLFVLERGLEYHPGKFFQTFHSFWYLIENIGHLPWFKVKRI